MIGNGFAFIVRVGSLALSYGILFIINNQFGSGSYGTYSYYLSFIYVYSTLLKFGFDVLALRLKEDSEVESSLLPTFYALSILEIIPSICLFYWLDADWRVLLSSHLFAFAFVYGELERRKDSPLLYILFTNALFLAFQFAGFLILNIKQMENILVCSFALNLAFLMIHLKIKHRYRLLLLPRVKDVTIFKDALSSAIISISSMMNNYGTIFIISFFTNPSMIGVFSIARRISNGVGLPYQVLNMMNPSKFLMKRNNQSEFNSYLSDQMKSFFHLGFVFPLICIPAIFLIPSFIDIPAHALQTFYVITSIFIISKAVDGVTGPSQTLIRLFGSLGKASRMQVIVYSSLAFLLILTGFLSKQFSGINVVIAASVFISIALSTINVVYISMLNRQGISLVAAFKRAFQKNSK